MIASRSEYRFVDIPAAIQVDSNVMPKRQQDDADYGTDTLKTLRGVDAAFLLESMQERKVATGALAYSDAVASKETFSREIDNSPFIAAASWIADRFTATPLLFRAKPAAAQPIYDADALSASYDYLYNVYSSPVTGRESDWLAFTTGPLQKAPVLAIYRDFNRLRHFCPLCAHSEASSAYVNAGAWDGTDPNSQQRLLDYYAQYSSGGSAIGGNIVFYHTAYYFGSNYIAAGQGLNFTARLDSGGTFNARTWYPNQADYIADAQAWALVRSDLSYTNTTSGASRTVTAHDWFPVASTFSSRADGDYFEVSASALLSACQLARNRREFYTLDTWQGMRSGDPAGLTSETFTQRVGKFALTADLTSHTDWYGFVYP